MLGHESFGVVEEVGPAVKHVKPGDYVTATDLLAWTRAHRRADGSYFTGLVHPQRETFPPNETSAYTGAAIILAADVVRGASNAADVFCFVDRG